MKKRIFHLSKTYDAIRIYQENREYIHSIKDNSICEYDIDDIPFIFISA